MANFRQPPNAGGAEAVIVSKNITANGTYNASSDNADGYDPVTVNVPSKTIVSKSITTNGTYNASSDNADGYNPVTVSVPGPTIVSKNITANGTYNASSDSADGYNPVTVAVPSQIITPQYQGRSYSYVATNGNLYHQSDNNNYLNIWNVESGTYLICVGSSTSNRNRLGYKLNTDYDDISNYVLTPGPSESVIVTALDGIDYNDNTVTTRHIVTMNNPGIIIFATSNVNTAIIPGYCIKLS